MTTVSRSAFFDQNRTALGHIVGQEGAHVQNFITGTGHGSNHIENQSLAHTGTSNRGNQGWNTPTMKSSTIGLISCRPFQQSSICIDREKQELCRILWHKPPQGLPYDPYHHAVLKPQRWLPSFRRPDFLSPESNFLYTA